MYRCRCMACILAALYFAVPFQATLAPPRSPPPFPPGAKVSLLLDKQTYFLGENILVHLCVENTGTRPFSVNTGGDYRLASRSLRFHVSAIDEQGKEVPDPDASAFSLGGLMGSDEVQPGKTFFLSEPLMRYCRFEMPGTYRLKAYHDLGWAHAPTAEATIQLRMPTPLQARMVVEEMFRLRKHGAKVMWEKQSPYADFSTLAYPVYLPILLPRAASGSEEALEAIANTPALEATAALISLATNKDPRFVRKVIQHINFRLPDLQMEGKLRQRNLFFSDRLEARRWLADKSWKPEYAAPVKRLSLSLLTPDADVEALQCVAFTLQCLGQKEDAAALTRGFDRAILLLPSAKTDESTRYKIGEACSEFVRAATALEARGMDFPTQPHTPGEQVLFLFGLAARKSFRPGQWEATYAKLLQGDPPYVRKRAAYHLPSVPTEKLLALVPKVLEDPDTDVVVAACRAIGELKNPSMGASLKKLLGTTKDKDIMRAASDAAYDLLPPLERKQILVSRLDDEAVYATCLSDLRGIVAGWSSCSVGSKYSAEEAKKTRAHWQEFLRKHGQEIAAGKSWQFDDPALPVQELLPGYRFERARFAERQGNELLEK
jgi:HEAT repeats